MSKGFKVAWWIFVLFNFLFAILGVVVFGVGVYLKVARADFMDVLESTGFETATAFMIMCGIIVFVISIVGFAGIWLKNQCIIGMYMVFVIIVFGFELAAGIIAYTDRNQFEADLMNDLKAGLKNTKRRSAWDQVQETFECCGVNNATDWQGVYDSQNPSTIPDSCCGYENCGQSGTQVAWTIGCFADAKQWLEENFILLGASAIVVAVVHIILIVAPIALIYYMRREKMLIY